MKNVLPFGLFHCGFLYARIKNLALFAVALCCVHADCAEPDAHALFDTYDHEIRPLLAEYCYKCHGNGKKKGDIILDGALSPDPLQWKPGAWVSAITQLRDGDMPPEEAPKHPTKAQSEQIARWMAQAVALADRVQPADPGFVALHRLNRTEYNNTVRDLTGADFDAAENFPADDSGYGFDNIADVLTISPLLTEKYLESAERIAEYAVKNEGDPNDGAHVSLALASAKVSTTGINKSPSELGFLSNSDATFACTLIPGKAYALRVRAWQDPGGPDDAEMAVRVGAADAGTVKVTTSRDSPREYSIPIKSEKQNETITISFTNDFYDEKYKDAGRRDRNLYVDHVELRGPLNASPAESQKKIFVAFPGKMEADNLAAGKIVRRFATRAFRRPLKDAECEALLRVFSAARKDAPFQAAIGVALKAVLVSPHFLFRVESKPAGLPNGSTVWELNDYEIAARLSYFFWSTMPDEELFTLAARGALKDRKVRDEQVRRMLKDPRSNQMVENFAGQWLELRNMEDVARDSRAFPLYKGEVPEYMKREAILFFDSIVREDRSIMTFVDSDYTFVNGPLARIYDLPNVKGREFQRVTLKDSPRGGVITMGSTLTLTSNPTRTSPVKRGKWVLDHILGTPPPPPPPEVPPLKEGQKDAENAPLRVRLEQHRKDPNCAICHIRMDGIGFSLENFDPIGHWRDKDGKFPIDAKGEMPGARPFNGARELKALLMQHRQVVVRNFVQKLMTYALGRGVKPYDRQTVNQIVRFVDGNEQRFSSVVLGIVDSDAFLKRRERRGDE